MQEELITTDNISQELLKSVFDAAFMDPTVDGDGDILIKDDVKVYVRLGDKKDRIRFICQFGFTEDSSPLARLQCVNLINTEYIMARAHVTDTTLIFNYDLLVSGGLSKKALVMALKRFASIPRDAVADHGKGIVE